MIQVTPTQMVQLLKMQVPEEPMMFVGAPGIGKSDIVTMFGLDFVGDVLAQYPTYQEPCDISGLGWVYESKKNGKVTADHVVFEDMKRLLTADKPLLVFLDDFGQATNAMQAGWMPPLLARTIAGKRISDHVRFVLCTNRRQDRANVAGVLQTVQTRMTGGIYELIPSTRDWRIWALRKKLPVELVQFIGRMEGVRGDNDQRVGRLLDPTPSREIEGSYCPRSVASVGYAQNRSIPKDLEYVVFAGKCGEGWATEYCAFLEIRRELPSFETIVMMPDQAPIPDNNSPKGVSALFAMCGELASKAEPDNFDSIMQYAMRLPEEFQAMLIEDATMEEGGKPELMQTSTYVRYLTTTKASRQAVGL